MVLAEDNPKMPTPNGKGTETGVRVVPDRHQQHPRDHDQVLRRGRSRGRAGRHPGGHEAGCLHRHPAHAEPRGDHRGPPRAQHRGDHPRSPRHARPAQPARAGDQRGGGADPGAVRWQRRHQRPEEQSGVQRPHRDWRVRRWGNGHRGRPRSRRLDRGHEGAGFRLRRAGRRRGRSRRGALGADRRTAHAGRAPAHEGNGDPASLQRRAPAGGGGGEGETLRGICQRRFRRRRCPRQSRPQGRSLRGGRPGSRGHRGHDDPAGRGRGHGRRRGQAPARPRHPHPASRGHRRRESHRGPQGQRPNRAEARRRADFAGGHQGLPGRDQPPGVAHPRLRLVARERDHLEHQLPAARQPGGLGVAGAPKAPLEVRVVHPSRARATGSASAARRTCQGLRVGSRRPMVNKTNRESYATLSVSGCVSRLMSPKGRNRSSLKIAYYRLIKSLLYFSRERGEMKRRQNRFSSHPDNPARMP